MYIPPKTHITWVLLVLLSVIGYGCALFSVFPEDSSIVAVVNGYNISMDALQKRLTNIHRFKPMGEAGKIDIQGIVEDLINDRLIIQEAYRVELDKNPLFQKDVNNYIKIRSVIRLRKEEVDDKISVTEEELREYFTTYHEEIKVRQIVTKERKKAEEILNLLRSGADFVTTAKEKSEWGNERGGDLGFIRRGKMEEAFEKAAFALEQGEISDIVETGSAFHIIRLDERRPAPEEEFEKAKKNIKKKLLKEKEAKRSNDYIAELKGKAEIWVDKELLYALDLNASDCDASTILARVNERPITACDFMEEANQTRQAKSHRNKKKSDRANQDILDKLVTYELVEQEALGRNYMDDISFKNEIEEYKENQLIKLFKQEIILPRTIPTDKELKEYYETHKDDFKKDYEVWFSEMVFSNSDDAEAVLKELRDGADFEFMASRESSNTPRTGINVWIPYRHLSPEMREGIKALSVGEVSEIIKDSRKSKIIKLKGRRGGEPEDFSRVVDKVRQAVVRNKFSQWGQEYLGELKSLSSIYVNKKLLDELTEKYTKGN